MSISIDGGISVNNISGNGCRCNIVLLDQHFSMPQRKHLWRELRQNLLFVKEEVDMNVLIVGSGTVESTEIIKELSDIWILICADGGARYFDKQEFNLIFYLVILTQSILK